MWWLAKRSGPVVERPVAMAPATAPTTAPSAVAPTRAGGLVIPVSGVWPAQLSDTWGDARGDGTRAHHAIDIMAPKGTPVVAAAAGTVEKIFESENGGHTVYVRRADPAWVDYYAHLDAYAPGLTEGMKLGQGQLIGAVGSTGDASPDAPHLHYEIKHMAPGEKWHQGTEVDPYPILAR
ncbi:M23 family metallopeptidase [Sphingomonas sp. BIUV-7]|uniref:M23 family metallopeptidase n=1 Tax=Sphingomonas natans TaxID=3063330 RepID=A0ABT8Y3M2_9SPHN|nr:M23 family metallopeptidase [Sphingomonas sp. BIUV-7]MDO6412911.1 M23 family metallopeptidase [Sphingomonas sp. BIUV-7]